MEIDFIPFQIGMQYENWEFDLESIELDTKLPYDKYLYFKKDIKELFGVEVQYIYLYFNLDILFKVEIIYKPSSPVQGFMYLVSCLENKYGKLPLTSSEDSMILSKTWKDPIKNLLVEHHFRSNQVSIILIDIKYLGQT